MALIQKIGTVDFKNSQPIKRKFNLCNFRPVYSKNLVTDTVSFSGNSGLKDIEEEIKSVPRKENYYLREREVSNIVNSVSPKNRPFLKDIISLQNGTFPEGEIIELLEYINRPDVETENFKKKIDVFRSIKDVVKSPLIPSSPIANYIDDIPYDSVVEILKSDALLNQPDTDFRSFIDTYNYAAKRLQKLKKDAIKKGKEFDEEYEAKNIMQTIFANWVILGMVFDENVLNEFAYNRKKYLDTVYMPRFRSLNTDDLKLLRQIQLYGVTEKENQSDDISTYPISIDDRVKMVNLLAANRQKINEGKNGLNLKKYIFPTGSQNIKIDFKNLQIDLLKKNLFDLGISTEEINTYIKQFKAEKDIIHTRHKYWDINYSHLFNVHPDSLMGKIIISATKGTFNDLIYKNGELAEINKLNKKAFEKEGLNYEKWLNPKIPLSPINFYPKPINPNTCKIKPHPKRKSHVNLPKIKGMHTFTVKNWNRIPQESLFDGNYTTCCTGIDKIHGPSFLHYLTNTCTTTLEVRNENNKVVGMSRLLVAKLGKEFDFLTPKKLALVIENIEVNSNVAKNYLYTDDAKYAFREMVFEYARKMAKEIAPDKDIPVYFAARNFKVKDIGLALNEAEEFTEVELVGEYPQKLYINSYNGIYDNASDAHREDGDTFRMLLTDVSKKTQPIRSDKKEKNNDDNYNYEDKDNYK